MDPDGHCCLGDDGGIDPVSVVEGFVDALHSINYVAGAVKAFTSALINQQTVRSRRVIKMLPK